MLIKITKKDKSYRTIKKVASK